MNDDREGLEDAYQRTRRGVSGDPTPDHEYTDDATPDTEPPHVGGVAVQHLAAEMDAKTSMTKQQATAWLLRYVEGVPRDLAAEQMGISTSTLDEHLRKARCKIDAANELRRFVDELEN